jgi:hypothetical protein
MTRFLAKPATLAVAALAAFSMTAPSFATTYEGTVTKNKHHHTTSTYKTGTYWERHPKVKSAAVGAGVGTAAGAVTGLVTHKGIMHGAVIGAGTGAGVGLIRSSDTMKRHPIVKNTLTGTTIGAGLGMAGGRGHHPAVKSAAVGSAIGLGYGVFKDLH